MIVYINMQSPPTVKTYTSVDGYIPARPLETTWKDLRFVVIDEWRDLVEDSTITTTPQKDGGCIIPSRLKRGPHDKADGIDYWRLKKLCTHVSLLILDIEETKIGDNASDVLNWFHSYFPLNQHALIYTSWNHGVRFSDGDPKWKPKHPRFRVVIPLSRPVKAGEQYDSLWGHMYRYLDDVPDKACSDPSRASYTYRHRAPDAELEPWWIEVGSEALDVDNLPVIEAETPHDSEAPQDVVRPSTSTPTSTSTVSVEALENARKESQDRREEVRSKRQKRIDEGVLDPAPPRVKKRYLKGALRRMCTEITSADKGTRHATIASRSGKVGTMIQGVDVDLKLVVTVLYKAAQQTLPPSRHRGALKTIKDQIEWGLSEADPYDWSHLATISKTGAVAIEFDGPPPVGTLTPITIEYGSNGSD